MISLDDCWLFAGHINESGYGIIYINHKRYYVHRVAYESFVGKIPKGLHIDHLCRVRSCMNPKHLEAVTLVENVMRGDAPMAINARKTHCLNGHEYTADNIMNIKSRPNTRRCKICDKKRKYDNYHKTKLALQQPNTSKEVDDA